MTFSSIAEIILWYAGQIVYYVILYIFQIIVFLSLYFVARLNFFFLFNVYLWIVSNFEVDIKTSKIICLIKEAFENQIMYIWSNSI